MMRVPFDRYASDILDLIHDCLKPVPDVNNFTFQVNKRSCVINMEPHMLHKVMLFLMCYKKYDLLFNFISIFNPHNSSPKYSVLVEFIALVKDKQLELLEGNEFDEDIELDRLTRLIQYCFTTPMHDFILRNYLSMKSLGKYVGNPIPRRMLLFFKYVQIHESSMLIDGSVQEWVNILLSCNQYGMCDDLIETKGSGIPFGNILYAYVDRNMEAEVIYLMHKPNLTFDFTKRWRYNPSPPINGVQISKKDDDAINRYIEVPPGIEDANAKTIDQRALDADISDTIKQLVFRGRMCKVNDIDPQSNNCIMDGVELTCLNPGKPIFVNANAGCQAGTRCISEDTKIHSIDNNEDRRDPFTRQNGAEMVQVNGIIDLLFGQEFNEDGEPILRHPSRPHPPQ